MKYKIALFDADGVLTLPEEFFATVYAKENKLDPTPFNQFFKNDWADFVTGKKDLKEHIQDNPQFWQWTDDASNLLDHWFKVEDVRNTELLDFIDELRKNGVFCYLATDQEKYRTEYMKSAMFKDRFDGYFVSCELGVTKNDPKFFELVLSKLSLAHEGLEPNDVVFYDDSQSKVDSARSLGIDGQLYQGVDQVKEFICEHT